MYTGPTNLDSQTPDEVRLKCMHTLFNPHQQAKVALAALKGDKPIVQLSSEFHVHSTQIEQWKDTLLKGASRLFQDKSPTKEAQRIAALERLVGQRDLEIEWMKKKLRVPDAP